MSDVPRPAADASPRAHRVQGWWLVLLATGGFVGILIIGLSLVAWLSPARGRSWSAGLGEQVMPDGTVLVLEAITVGTRHEFHHQWGPPEEPFDWLFGPGPKKYREDFSTHRERQVVWLTRREAQTGRQLDFDWWLKCVAVDDHGWQIADDNPGRAARTEQGSYSSYGGQRPFAPVSGETPRTIVVHSELPLMRPAGQKIRLMVYDKSQSVVAEFELPTPPARTIPEWAPETLPSTKSDRDLSVTLNELAVRFDISGRSPAGARPDFRIEPRFVVSREGTPATEWDTTEYELTDALGNTGTPWNCRLSPFEPAWKLHMRLFRSAPASFDPAERFELKDIPLPDVGNSRALGESFTVGRVTVTFLSVGNGRVVYTEPAGSHSSGGSSSTSGQVGEKRDPYRIEQSTGAGLRTLTVDAPVPHLCYRFSGLDANHRTQLLITGEQGETIPQESNALGETQIQLLPKLAGAKAMNVVCFIHEGREVEFLVEPPAELRKLINSGAPRANE